MNPSTPTTPNAIGTAPNNTESLTQQSSIPHVNRIVTQEGIFSPATFRGPSEDEQSFGVTDELSSSSNEDMDEGGQYAAGDDIHLTQTPVCRPINVKSIPTQKIVSPIVKKKEISENIQLQNKKARIKPINSRLLCVRHYERRN